MKIESELNCPLDNFNQCKKLKCAWFIKLRGVNPNTGVDVDEWGCAVAWMPILSIENSQMQRQTGAAVESFRNEMVKMNESTSKILIKDNKNQKLIQA
jgi:hypothetical protein